MTDRKMLELAARAADYKVLWCLNGVEGDERECFVFVDTGERWEPKDDDGDALRLAVKLRMSIEHSLSWSQAETFAHGWREPVENDDQCAATRIAIVRVAAEIGRMGAR